MVIRSATPADLPVVGRLGALLMRVHHEFDAERFLAPGTNPERRLRLVPRHADRG